MNFAVMDQGMLRRALALLALMLCSLPAVPQPAQAADPAPTRGVLDGWQFAGTFGPVGSGGRPDILTFSDGQFWSSVCVPCGFVPVLYWVRHDGDAIHFRGEMHSRDRGRFTYTGVIRDGVLNADVRWQKDRWYWSVDRMLRFEGKRISAVVTDPVAAVTQRALKAGIKPEPSAVCPL